LAELAVAVLLEVPPSLMGGAMRRFRVEARVDDFLAGGVIAERSGVLASNKRWFVVTFISSNSNIINLLYLTCPSLIYYFFTDKR
jgi:hypothetical protein